jgi:hypothetical protein
MSSWPWTKWHRVLTAVVGGGDAGHAERNLPGPARGTTTAAKDQTAQRADGSDTGIGSRTFKNSSTAAVIRSPSARDSL